MSPECPPLLLEGFGSFEGFDSNAAFQSALTGIMEDEELLLDQKVQCIEAVITESASDLYREFVDFRALAAQVELFCTHDHGLRQAVESNDVVSSFMSSHTSRDEHDHSHGNNASQAHTKKDRKKSKTKAEVHNMASLLAWMGSRSILSFFASDRQPKNKRVRPKAA